MPRRDPDGIPAGTARTVLPVAVCAGATAIIRFGIPVVAEAGNAMAIVGARLIGSVIAAAPATFSALVLVRHSPPTQTRICLTQLSVDAPSSETPFNE